MSADPLEAVRVQIQQHAEERKRLFVVGFVRFVIERGAGAIAPTQADGKPETWQAVGRRLYGVSLFNQVLTDELAAIAASKVTSGATHAEV